MKIFLQIERGKTFLLALLLSVAGMMRAQTFTVGNLNYSINDDGTTVTLTGHVDGENATGSLVIPESVDLYDVSYPITRIGGYAFNFNSGLTGDLVIPNSVTEIQERAFRHCSGLTGKLTLGNSLVTLDWECFESCGFTGAVTIPSSMIRINNRVFAGCSGITTLNYNAEWANEWCCGGGDWYNWLVGTSITTVNIGEGVRYIPCDFMNDNGLSISHITLPESVTHIGGNAFYNFSGTVNIPSHVQVLYDGAFSNCSGLTGQLSLPETLTHIGSYAFYNCTNLSGTLTVPNNVTFIGEYAFSGCSGFSGTLTLGSSLDEIQQLAFFGTMEGITEIHILDMTPPSLGSNVFLGSSAEMPVYVPCGTTEAYQNTTGWNGFANIMETDPCQWLIQATARPTVGGTVSGAGIYEEGTTCTLTATAIGDFVFSHWSENGAEVSTNATYSFTVEGSRSLVAIFSNPNFITFADANVEARCIELWDTDGDGFLSYAEAAAVTNLGCAFQYWDNITSFNELQYFTGLDHINGYEFWYCTSLASIILPESITYIGYRAFAGCSSLASITIPEAVTQIEYCAFGYCSSLTALNYQATDCSVSDGWLEGVSSLTTLVIGDNVQTIPYYFVGNQTNLSGTLSLPSSLTTIGAYAFYNCSGLTGTLTIPASVTSIGGYAFNNCSGLTGTLTIPENVTTIGGRAFGSTGFATLNYNATNCTEMGGESYDENWNWMWATAFQNSAITTLNIGANVQTIPYQAFAGMDNLTGTVTIPAAVTQIGDGAFAGTGITAVNYNATNCGYMGSYDYTVFANCGSLTRLTIGANVEVIPYYAFKDCSNITGRLVLPNSLVTIGQMAFRECSGLTGTLVIPNTVTSIGGNAFYHCYGLTGTLSIPNSVETIGVGAFIDCGFTGVLTIGTGVVSMDRSAFRRCTGITEVHWNAINCTYAGGDWDYPIFNECSNLTTVVFADNVETIPGYAFINSSSLTGELNLPSSLTSIGEHAFYGCYGLTGQLVIPDAVSYIGYGSFCSTGFSGTLKIGNAVSEIGDGAFDYTGINTLEYNAANCGYIGNSWENDNASVFYAIPTVNFGESVESLPARAFRNCTNLGGTLALPASLSSIGDQAFYNCYGIESLELGEMVEYIGAEAFRNCAGLRGELTLPETLISVGNHAFASCDEISTINYNATHCETMGNAQSPVFFDCVSIAHINIGANVESIPNFAFKRCSTVTDMSVAAVVPPTIYSSTFGTVSRSIPVSVPYGSGDDYRAAPYWEEFFNITEDYTPTQYSYHYNFDIHQYPFNMTVVGIIQIDSVEQATDALEIGAFVGDECRGRQMLAYYPAADRYLLFLMLYGDEEDESVFSFRLYDHEAGEELPMGCIASITFEADATLGDIDEPFVFNFTNGQITNFYAGWNWWSTYVEADDLMDQMKSGLGADGKQIKSQSKFTMNYGSTWMGQLNSIENDQTYMIQANNACTVELTGAPVNPADYPITLNTGWKWIGYPCTEEMNVSDALAGITPTAGDQIKAQGNFATYYNNIGWMGSLRKLTPGAGYMYKLNGSSQTLVFPNGGRGELAKNITADGNHWTPELHAYPSNMTVMAVVELEGSELRSEDYELAAFANGEVRGSAKLMYVEPLDRYMAFLTIAGDEAAELRFGLYDGTDECLDSDDFIVYATDAVVGTPDAPMVVRFRGTTGLGETENSLFVYPNPVSDKLNVKATAGGRIEVYSVIGELVYSKDGCSENTEIHVGDLSAGTYIIRMTSDSSVQITRFVKE